LFFIFCLLHGLAAALNHQWFALWSFII